MPQKIESFQFVQFQQSNPAEERRDPNSQREGFQLAADPSYRVFVVYLDNLHVDFGGSHQSRLPLITFLNRVLGPKDLFGVMTTVQRPQDLILGQQTLMIEEQLTKYWDWGRGSRVLEDDADLMLQSCFPGRAGELIARRRTDEVFSDLEGLSTMLADIREERKNILLVSNGWWLPGPSNRLTETIAPQKPSIGVSNEGQPTLGARRGEVSERWCQEQLQRLSSIDFQQRQRDLLDLARRSNVTFYALRPIGLAAPATVEGMRADRDAVDSLLVLSNNTDGIAVVNTNDLTTGARKIADDLAASSRARLLPDEHESRRASPEDHRSFEGNERDRPRASRIPRPDRAGDCVFARRGHSPHRSRGCERRRERARGTETSSPGRSGAHAWHCAWR